MGDEANVVNLSSVVSFLRSKGHHAALCELLIETPRISGDSADADEIDAVRRMVLKGEWTKAVAYLSQLSISLPGLDLKSIETQLLTQQLLESLSWQQGNFRRHLWRAPPGIRVNPELDGECIMRLLKSLELVSEPSHFSTLCYCLKLDDLSKHLDPSISSWSSAKGRLDCADMVENSLSPLFHNIATEPAPPRQISLSTPAAEATTKNEPILSANKDSAINIKHGLPFSERGKRDLWEGLSPDHSASYAVLWQTQSPLRCLSVLSEETEGRAEREFLAVGSNAHAIHLLSHSKLNGASVTRGGRNIDLAGRLESETLDAHRGSVYCMDYRPQRNGQGMLSLLVSGSNDKTLRLSSLQRASFVDSSSDPSASILLRGHTGTVRCVEFGPDERLRSVASAGSGDNRTRLWDCDTGNSCRPLHFFLFCL